MLFEQTLVARELLQAQGKSVGLINLRSLKPIDEAALLEVVRRGSLIVTVEDHFITGGLYSILAEVLLRNQLTARVLPLALEERWYRPGRLSAVLEYEGFTGHHIARRITEYLGESGAAIAEGPAVLENEFAE